MIQRQRAAIPWPAMLATGAVLIALVAAAKATAPGPGDPRVRVAGALVGLLVVWVIAYVPPSWSLSAALALSMFGSNWQNLGLPSSVAPDRIVLGLTLIAIAVRAPGSRDRVKIPWRPLYGLMFFAGAYAIGSAIATGAISHHSEIFTLIDRLQLMDWAMFIVAPAALTTEADRRVLLATLLGMGLYLGLTTVFEILGPRSLVFPRYINNPALGVQYGRGRGPFLESTTNGIALYACLLGALMAIVAWRERWVRWLAGFTVALCTLALLFTFQRTVWLGVGASVLLMLIFVPGLRRLLVAAVLAIALIVGIAFVALPTVREHAASRASDVQTVEAREALDAAGINMVLQRPLFGFGFGSFPTVSRDYFSISNSYSVWSVKVLIAHDVYLAVATELGLVGVTGWLLVILIGVGATVLAGRGPPDAQRWRIAVGAMLIMWLVAGVSSPLAGSFEALVLWLFASAVAGAELGQRGSPAGVIAS